MAELDLSYNRFSGSIPNALGINLRMLEYLSHNSLLGSVPDSVSKLINVNVLNLSSNFLSGPIPESLADLRYLVAINLSFNRLEGQIPNPGAFQNLTFQSLVGNLALCGMPRLGFPPCSSSNSTGHHSRVVHIVLPIVASAVLMVVVVAAVFLVSKRKKGVVNETPIFAKQLADQRFISYQEMIRATENFNEANLLGRGSSGSVFRGYLDDGMVVAVKVLNPETEGEGAFESFKTECRALCMARHRNIVKIIGTCSNLNFKALILQFMPNGLAGRVSRKADVHSYGVLLLETFTRRKPTDVMFNGDLSLQQWVYGAYPEVVLDIADRELLAASEDGERRSSIESQLQCLESLLELGLLCSEELPIQRIAMKEVVARLLKLRAGYLSACHTILNGS